MAVHALVLTVDVRLPASQSLKDKRAVLRSLLDGCRRRFVVAAAETDHQNTWQRAELAFSAVSGSAGHVGEIVDDVERFVWSFPELEVLSTQRCWLETD